MHLFPLMSHFTKTKAVESANPVENQTSLPAAKSVARHVEQKESKVDLKKINSAAEHYLTPDEKTTLLKRSPGMRQLLLLLKPANSQPKLADIVSVLERDDIDLSMLSGLLKRDDSSETNQGKYERNVIERTTAYEVSALVWRPGQSTAIHNHKESECVYKVLKGTISDHQYAVVANQSVMKVTTNVRTAGNINIAQKGDVHMLENSAPPAEETNTAEEVVNLHVYMPAIINPTIFSENN